MTITLYNGDMLGVLQMLPANSIDSAVLDPPYNLDTIRKRFGSMSAAACQFGTDGAYSRASTGFMGKEWDNDIMSDVDAWRHVLRVLKPGAHVLAFSHARTYHRMVSAMEEAGFEIRDQIMWLYGTGFPKAHDVGNGWKTALKPAHEPIVVARKPISEKTNVKNMQVHGVGAFNVEDSRVGDEVRINPPGGNACNLSIVGMPQDAAPRVAVGRFPANVIHDGEVLDGQEFAKFFYSAKANSSERPWHCKTCAACGPSCSPAGQKCPSCGGKTESHPTVKPQALMRYLCRLVTPRGGTVLDCFAGSGSTLQAARDEGFNAIGIELGPEYFRDIKTRLGL